MQSTIYWTKDVILNGGVLYCEEDGTGYEIDDFITSDTVQDFLRPEGDYDAVAYLTNTRALGVKFDENNQAEARLDYYKR